MSLIMRDFTYFHDHVMLVLILILTFVGMMMMFTLMNNSVDIYLLESQTLEVIWTLLPVFVLVYIGAPSLYILYGMDYDFIKPVNQSLFHLKVVGHQWYWSYSLMDIKNHEMVNFDSYMTPDNDLMLGSSRLLETDNRVPVPCEILLKIYVTAADVLHSWSVPSLGLKIDACPGRLNQTTCFITHPGVYYGQCSEICGANHSFMPICLESRELFKLI